MAKFQVGDKAFFIKSTIFVKEVVIVKIASGFAIIKYPDSSGGFRVRESRLFATKKEAKSNNKKVIQYL